MLAIPLALALTNLLLSDSMQLARLLPAIPFSYTLPAIGLVLSSICALLLMIGKTRIARHAILIYLVFSTIELASNVTLLVLNIARYGGDRRNKTACGLCIVVDLQHEFVCNDLLDT